MQGSKTSKKKNRKGENIESSNNIFQNGGDADTHGQLIHSKYVNMEEDDNHPNKILLKESTKLPEIR